MEKITRSSLTRSSILYILENQLFEMISFIPSAFMYGRLSTAKGSFLLRRLLFIYS